MSVFVKGYLIVNGQLLSLWILLGHNFLSIQNFIPATQVVLFFL